MKLKSPFVATLLALAAAAVLPQAGRAMPAMPLAAEQAEPLATPAHGRVYWRSGHPHWNGYRGYPHRRPGYRYHAGYWFPYRAFSFGIIIVPDHSTPTYRLNAAHYRWCENRYRSYWRHDNTFQPYVGPRRACVSPYMRRIR